MLSVHRRGEKKKSALSHYPCRNGIFLFSIETSGGKSDRVLEIFPLVVAEFEPAML